MAGCYPKYTGTKSLGDSCLQSFIISFILIIMSSSPLKNILEQYYSVPVFECACGRSALNQGLLASKLSRMKEIILPRYLCHAVMSSLCPFITPTYSYSADIQAVFVYHQFGYPQKLMIFQRLRKKKSLLIINDCVHSFWSTVDDKNISTFGDFFYFFIR